MEPAPISADELPAFVESVNSAFHYDVSPERIEKVRRVLELERTLAVRERGRIVAGAAIYSRRVTIPGAQAPLAGVTEVGVLPTHRRRGLLTALMRRQLADIHDRGREAVAGLWTSEGAIYGRFGYGPATMVAELEISVPEARLRATAAAGVELLRPAHALDAMRAIHEDVRRERPGMLDRDGPWWDRLIDDPESDREGAEPLRAAVVDGEAHALYAVKPRFDRGRAAGEVIVREVMASSPAGYAAIWGFLLGLDLNRRIYYELAPPDDPLMHAVTETRALRMTVGDALWLRLVDLPHALAERSYAHPFEVVLEIGDELCPWNAGRWALRWDGAAATCARTALPAGLELDVAALGAAYLGGPTLDELGHAGAVTELRAGALATASRAFRGDRAPWCPELF